MGNGRDGISYRKGKALFFPADGFSQSGNYRLSICHPPQVFIGKTDVGTGVKRLKPTDCPIIHSDQGVLYGTKEWVKMLKGKAIQSMSRRGNCYDNAVIESFFGILKSECFYTRNYTSITELQNELEKYLVYYNQKRIKLNLKALSPVQYRARYLT